MSMSGYNAFFASFFSSIKLVAVCILIVISSSGITADLCDSQAASDLSKASVSLEKYGQFDDVNKNGLGDVGESIRYSFTVSNTGDVPLKVIAVSDPLVAISVPPSQCLLPGGYISGVYEGEYRLTESDVDLGFVSNGATVLTKTPEGVEVRAFSNGGSALITKFITPSPKVPPDLNDLSDFYYTLLFMFLFLPLGLWFVTIVPRLFQS